MENVLDILRGGVDSALFAVGRSSVQELSGADLVMQPGFLRGLGLRRTAPRAVTFSKGG